MYVYYMPTQPPDETQPTGTKRERGNELGYELGYYLKINHLAEDYKSKWTKERCSDLSCNQEYIAGGVFENLMDPSWDMPKFISIPPNRSGTDSIMNWLRADAKPQTGPHSSTEVSPVAMVSSVSSVKSFGLDWLSEVPLDLPSGSNQSIGIKPVLVGSGSFWSLGKQESLDLLNIAGFSNPMQLDSSDESSDESSGWDEKPQSIILITTHGEIPVNPTPLTDEYNSNIVTITASTPGTVNYITGNEVKNWMNEVTNIITLATRFDTMRTIGENIKTFAEETSTYYARAIEIAEKYKTDSNSNLSLAIKEWDECSLNTSSGSQNAKDDFQNYFDNAKFGYKSCYFTNLPGISGEFYDKTYKNKGLLDDQSKKMKLGLIQICRADGKWTNFKIKRKNDAGKEVTFDGKSTKECNLSDILNTIESMPDLSNAVIIDLTCSVQSPEYFKCLDNYFRISWGREPTQKKSKIEGGSKSKKRKRKSNKNTQTKTQAKPQSKKTQEAPKIQTQS